MSKHQRKHRGPELSDTEQENREQYDNDYEEFHEQHQVYSRDRPESRPKSRRTLNTDTSRKESVPKGTNETPVEGKRNMEDKKGTVMGIGLDQLLTCGSVILCAILAYFVYNTNQQIEELKERLDKVPKTDDSVSIEKIQSMIMKETERMEKPLKLEIRDLRQNLMKEVTSKNSLEAGMVMLKAQQEKQGQKEELLTKTIEELKSDIKEWSDKFHALGNVISEINSTVKDHGKAADALRQEQKVMKESLEQTKNKVNDMKSRLTDHQRDIHEKSEEIRKRMAKADEDLKVFEKQMLSTTEKLQRHDKELDTAFDHLFNKKVAIAVITFMLFVLIVLVISVYKLCQNQTKSGSLAHGRSSQNGITGKNFSPVLEDVPFNPRLRPALGVISFSKEYQGLHRKLVQSVRANFQNGFEVEYCIIRDNIDIPNIPHCQLIVIFVEHTDRYVILEEEGDGLGNRNRVTLTAVKQIGAVPVIVYDNDPGSQRLAKDQLYSKEIWGAKVQEELMELSNCGRLFSVYETLSKSQELGLKKLIEDHALKSKTF